MGEQVQQWLTPSSSEEGVDYVVRRYPIGMEKWTCSCQGYWYQSRKHLNYECKHIKQQKEEMVIAFRGSLG